VRVSAPSATASLVNDYYSTAQSNHDLAESTSDATSLVPTPTSVLGYDSVDYLVNKEDSDTTTAASSSVPTVTPLGYEDYQLKKECDSEEDALMENSSSAMEPTATPSSVPTPDGYGSSVEDQSAYSMTAPANHLPTQLPADNLYSDAQTSTLSLMLLCALWL
jgi:hypothetical protein